MDKVEQESAFPGMEYDITAGQRYHLGVTIRDYFAGEALSGVCNIYYGSEGEKDIAYRAYKIADEMINQREQKEG